MKKAWEIVEASRKPERATALEYFGSIFTGFVELHGDRRFGDDKAVVGGVAWLDKQPVTVIGIQKGRGVQENVERNFGLPNPEGYRKALRLMQQAEKFGRPVVTFINTAGAYCGIGAEERGQSEAIARNLYEMSALNVPVVSILTGEGGSGGALALAVADKVFMLSGATYSILSPEGFASILWKDGSRAKEAAELMKMTARDLLALKIIDGIIDENDHTSADIKKLLKAELARLSGLSPEARVAARYERFRAMGRE